LLTAPTRRWAAVLLVCSVIVVAVLGVLFAHQGSADGFDRAVDAPFISAFSGHRNLLLWLAYPGSQIPAALMSLALAAGCLLAGRLNGAVLAAAAVPVSVGLDEGLLKPLFDRTYLGSLTYPSGHTTAMVALASVATVLLLLPPRPATAPVLRVLVPAVLWVLTAVVVVAVLALQWHYFTDTAGGAAVAVATICGLALLLDLPAVRSVLARLTRQPPEEAPPREVSGALDPARRRS
jgi:membrane-associated phospholipid phosphatase